MAHFFIFQRPIMQANPTTNENPKYCWYQLPTDLEMSEKNSGIINIAPRNPSTHIIVIAVGLFLFSSLFPG